MDLSYVANIQLFHTCYGSVQIEKLDSTTITQSIETSDSLFCAVLCEFKGFVSVKLV